MLKVVVSVFVASLLIGCAGNSTAPQKKSFRSVALKDVILVQKGKDREYCARCGMKLAKYYKTSHTAEIGDKKYQYCSFHCLEDHLGEGVTLKNPQVVDVSSLKFIDVTKAYYVVGSSQPATMSRISKYAFAKKEDAVAFQKRYGGKIMDFYEARKVVQEDFKHYR